MAAERLTKDQWGLQRAGVWCHRQTYCLDVVKLNLLYETLATKLTVKENTIQGVLLQLLLLLLIIIVLNLRRKLHQSTLHLTQ